MRGDVRFVSLKQFAVMAGSRADLALRRKVGAAFGGDLIDTTHPQAKAHLSRRRKRANGSGTMLVLCALRGCKKRFERQVSEKRGRFFCSIAHASAAPERGLRIDIAGVSITVKELAAATGRGVGAIQKALKRGESIARIMAPPSQAELVRESWARRKKRDP